MTVQRYDIFFIRTSLCTDFIVFFVNFLFTIRLQSCLHSVSRLFTYTTSDGDGG